MKAQARWPWRWLLERPAEGDHIVQIGRDPAFRAEVVAHFIAAGLRSHEAVLVIATPKQWDVYSELVRKSGVDLEDALVSGQIDLQDAEKTLSRLLVDGAPDWKKFRELITSKIRPLLVRYGKVRAYGEMVDLLWQRGERSEAMTLEKFWHDLAEIEPFSLLCAYCADPLECGLFGGPLEKICGAHSHIIPWKDYERAEAAVAEAGQEVLGESLGKMLQALAGSESKLADMPPAQATLFWLRRHMPIVWERVLTLVRARLCDQGQAA